MTTLLAVYLETGLLLALGGLALAALLRWGGGLVASAPRVWLKLGFALLGLALVPPLGSGVSACPPRARRRSRSGPAPARPSAARARPVAMAWTAPSSGQRAGRVAARANGAGCGTGPPRRRRPGSRDPAGPLAPATGAPVSSSPGGEAVWPRAPVRGRSGAGSLCGPGRWPGLHRGPHRAFSPTAAGCSWYSTTKPSTTGAAI